MSSDTPGRYQIVIARAALRSLESLPLASRARIVSKIDTLADNPRPHGVEKLTGEEDQYRVRVGNFRVIYTIQDGRLIVTVVRVADRRDAYRRRGN